MIKDVRREETSKFPALFGCTCNDEICFVGIEPKFIVCHLARDITETVTKLLRERSLSAVDKICIRECHPRINDNLICGSG